MSPSLTVDCPVYVPLIDAIDRLGVAVVKSGDTITIVFKDTDFMRLVGRELIKDNDESHDRITISSLTVSPEDIEITRKVVNELFPTKAAKPKPAKNPKPAKKPKRSPKPKPPKSLSETLIAAKHSLAEKGSAKIIFPEDLKPHIKKGSLVYYKQRETYKVKDVVMCKVGGDLAGACKLLTSEVNGQYLVDHGGQEAFATRIYGKITSKKLPKKAEVGKNGKKTTPGGPDVGTPKFLGDKMRDIAKGATKND